MNRVLLVDDDPNLRLLYRIRLKQAGYDIVAVATGAQALEVVIHQDIDMVVLDLQLPDCDGLQLLDEILSYQPSLPVIIHTAHEFWGNDFRSWGAVAYVIKSPDLSRLTASLAQFAPNTPSWRELASQAQAGDVAAVI